MDFTRKLDMSFCEVTTKKHLKKFKKLKLDKSSD